MHDPIHVIEQRLAKLVMTTKMPNKPINGFPIMPALWSEHHRKNACPLFIVKSEFQGYNDDDAREYGVISFPLTLRRQHEESGFTD